MWLGKEVGVSFMVSIFFLLKYGLTNRISRSVSTAGLSLLDFLLVDNEDVILKLESHSKREKVNIAIQNWLSDSEITTNVFDDVIMLNSTGKTVPSRVFQLYDSVEVLEEIIKQKITEDGGGSITDKKINQIVTEYQILISNSEEKTIWDAFIIFLKNPSISIKNLESFKLNIEIINKLKIKNLVFEDEEVLYLNIDNLFYKNRLIDYFKIDCSIIPTKKEIHKKLTLDDLLKLDFNDKDIFIQRLNGLTLQEIADKVAITRERVRQRLNKVISKLPEIEEIKRFSKIYREYDISKDIFVNVFNPDVRVYYLLSFLFKKGNKDILEEVLRGDYSEKSKEFMLKSSRKVQIGTDIKTATKENSLVEVLKENKDLQLYLTKDELFYLYNEHVANYPKLRIANQRSLTNSADRIKNIIKSNTKGYRFFDIHLSDNIINTLNEIITSQPPGAYNMEYIYNKNKDFMEQLNIFDGSELHNLYLKYEILVPNMVLGRNPEFSIGITSKKDFVFQEMITYNERNIDEFVDYINKNYGLLKHSFKAYLFNEVPEYIGNGMILIDLEDYSGINDLLKVYLQDEIYLREDFEEIITKNSTITEISPSLIYLLGFLDRGTLVISNKFSSSKEALTARILSKKVFSTEGEKIYKTNDYLTTKYSLEKDFRIIKIGEDKYLNTSSLKSRGFDLGKFQSFVNKVESIVDFNSYFTIKSILDSGFKHDLIDDGFELITLDRLLSTSDLFLSVTSSFPTLYYKGEKKFLNDFLLDLLLEYGNVNLEDFTDDINDKYGLNLEEENIRSRLLQEDVFYSKELNKVYIYKDDYLDEVYGK